MKKQIFTVVMIVNSLALINAGWLLLAKYRYQRDIHASPFYSVYLATRALLLNPQTVIIFAIVVSIWIFVMWRRSRRKPSLRNDELIALGMLLAIIEGFILTACFKL